MNNTIELIQNMLQSSEVVKSLPIIGEIAIKDEPGYRTIFAEAGIGALITLCATYMGSKFGSKKTVKLFKEEEKSCLNCGARNTEWCKRLCSSTDLSEWIPKE